MDGAVIIGVLVAILDDDMLSPPSPETLMEWEMYVLFTITFKCSPVFGKLDKRLV